MATAACRAGTPSASFTCDAEVVLEVMAGGAFEPAEMLSVMIKC